MAFLFTAWLLVAAASALSEDDTAGAGLAYRQLHHDHAEARRARIDEEEAGVGASPERLEALRDVEARLARVVDLVHQKADAMMIACATARGVDVDRRSIALTPAGPVLLPPVVRQRKWQTPPPLQCSAEALVTAEIIAKARRLVALDELLMSTSWAYADQDEQRARRQEREALAGYFSGDVSLAPLTITFVEAKRAQALRIPVATMQPVPAGPLPSVTVRHVENLKLGAAR